MQNILWKKLHKLFTAINYKHVDNKAELYSYMYRHVYNFVVRQQACRLVKISSRHRDDKGLKTGRHGRNLIVKI